MRAIFFSIIFLFILFAASPVAAFVPSDEAWLSTVLVVCGDRKGSGVITDGAAGYVITGGHIAINPFTGSIEETCTLRMPTTSNFIAAAIYNAEVVHAVFDLEHDVDFAVLHIAGHVAGPPIQIPSGLTVNLSASAGDEISVLGYPQSANDVQVSEGYLIGYERGIMTGDAPIQEGNSGGPVVDIDGALIGIAMRIRFTTDSQTGERQTIDYGYGDVASLLNWLDTVDPEGMHDRYVHHADFSADHALPYVIRDATAGCDDLVRTQNSSTVYCLRTGSHRAAFPDAATYASWFGGFEDVKYISATNLAEYGLTGLVTHKAGTLVKIQTDPKVYLVTDTIGTLRWIATETLAAQLFGLDWAKKVIDVPETFFPTYAIGAPLE